MGEKDLGFQISDLGFGESEEGRGKWEFERLSTALYPQSTINLCAFAPLREIFSRKSTGREGMEKNCRTPNTAFYGTRMPAGVALASAGTPTKTHPKGNRVSQTLVFTGNPAAGAAVRAARRNCSPDSRRLQKPRREADVPQTPFFTAFARHSSEERVVREKRAKTTSREKLVRKPLFSRENPGYSSPVPPGSANKGKIRPVRTGPRPAAATGRRRPANRRPWQRNCATGEAMPCTNVVVVAAGKFRRSFRANELRQQRPHDTSEKSTTKSGSDLHIYSGASAASRIGTDRCGLARRPVQSQRHVIVSHRRRRRTMIRGADGVYCYDLRQRPKGS